MHSNHLLAGSLVTARLLCFGATLLASSALSQSPITTLFASDNGGNVGGTIYFDLEIPPGPPIWIHGIDLNLGSPIGAPGMLNVHVCPLGRRDFQRSPDMWTLVGAAPLIAAGVNLPTHVMPPPFVLAPGRYGIAYQVVGVKHAYTDGTGFNQVYANADMTIRCGEACNGAFAGAAVFSPRVVNTSIHYAFGGAIPNWATAARFGRSCGVAPYASFYEHFPLAGAFDLAGASMTLVHGAAGYMVIPGGAFVPPTPAAAVLALGDDTKVMMPLGSLMPIPGQPSTPAIEICSNGFVSAATGNTTSWVPSVESFLAMPQSVWGSWHDYNPAAAGSGPVLFEEIGLVSFVTWLGVADHGVPGSASTFQLQFDRGTGNVVFAWLGMSLLGNGHLVGYSPGGASAVPDGTDLSVALPIATSTLDTAPRLSPLSRPALGTMLALETTSVPPGTALGALAIGLVRFDPGINLAGFSMPKCELYASLDHFQIAVPIGDSWGDLFAIPAAAGLVGFPLAAQSLTFTAGANPMGMLVSNGLTLVIGMQ